MDKYLFIFSFSFFFSSIFIFITHTRQYSDVISLSHNIRAFIERLPKARATKIVRTMIDKVSEVYENSVLTKAPLEEITALKDCCEKLCNDTLNWAVATQRQFLVQRVKMKICALYEQIFPLSFSKKIVCYANVSLQLLLAFSFIFYD